MKKALYKRLGLDGLFTDFKHHAKSWANSKRMRTKRERQKLAKMFRTSITRHLSGKPL